MPVSAFLRLQPARIVHLSLWDSNQLAQHGVVARSTELSTLDLIRAGLVSSEPIVVHMSRNGIDVDAQLRNEKAVSDIERNYLQINYFADSHIELVLHGQSVGEVSCRSVREGHCAPVIILKSPVELSSNHRDMR